MKYIAGIDEAGRGCIAGPVVAAAVILPREYVLPMLTDSKKLTPQQRDTLAIAIKEQAYSWGVAFSSSFLVDSINVLQATFHAMSQALMQLSTVPVTLHIDGNAIIPRKILSLYSPLINQEAYIKGDLTHPHISAASILAKTTRDTYMCTLSTYYPEYNFSQHKGYPTCKHYEAIKKYGIIPEHRKTFAGVLCNNLQKKLEI
ncbi:MAG: ribonuclease HII [Desulfovibrionaceae bacterium]